MDDPGSPMAIIFVLVLIFINAFFAMSEIAFISLNDTKLRRDAEEGSRKAKLITKLLDEPNNFLATIQVAITLSGLLSSAVAADVYADPAAEFLAKYIPIDPDIVHGATVFVLTLLLSYVSLVLGELVPKRIAMHYPEKISYAIAGILSFCHKLFRPFVILLSGSTNIVLRLFGINPNEEPEEATEENIRMMLDVADEKGTIEESEKEMINNIFEFDDRSVGEIMTHRKDLTAIEIATPICEAVDLAISDGYSRMPVYEETIDNIKGLVYAKDLLSLIGDTNLGGRTVTDFIRPANFIPESNSCREAFMEFQQKKIQAAIVVDEYGGTAGLVSMEDLIESVMGNIQDEYDNEEEEINEIDEDNFDFEGTVLLDDIEEILDITVDEDVDYDTISGLIMDLLGRIPEEDEHPVIEYQGVEFTVMQVEEHRIAKVHARILPKEVLEEE
ncbi:MAG: HlyC/CorC family transporter [Oscillospiraceae bacterium]|nr:HlyC/CorC family transporter [Oscillospiraceae bacterium]